MSNKIACFYARLFLLICPIVLLEAAQCPNTTNCPVLNTRETDCVRHALPSNSSESTFLITPKNESYSLIVCSPSVTTRPTYFFQFVPTRTGEYEITATSIDFEPDENLLIEVRMCNDKFYGCNNNKDNGLIPYVVSNFYEGVMYVASVQRLGSENEYRNDTFRLNFLRTGEALTFPPTFPPTPKTKTPTYRTESPTTQYSGESNSMKNGGQFVAVLLGVVFGGIIWLFLVLAMICFIRKFFTLFLCRPLSREARELREEKRYNEERRRSAERNLRRQVEEEEENNKISLVRDDAELGIPVARVVPKASIVDALDKFDEARPEMSPHASTPSATVTMRTTGPSSSNFDVLNRSGANTSYVGSTPSTERRSYFTRYHGNEDLAEENGTSIDAVPEASMTPQ